MAQETYDGSSSGGNNNVCNSLFVSLTEFLKPIMGDNFANVPHKEQTEDNEANFIKWFQKNH